MRYVRHGLCGKCGVYLITCTVNGKRYVGASTDIGARINQHFEKNCLRKYADINPFYADIRTYGRDAFTVEALEFCPREQKLETERKWYHSLKPEYNMVEPDDCPFRHKAVREKSLRNYQMFVEKRRQERNQKPKEYKEKVRRSNLSKKCKEKQREHMIPCRAIDDNGNEHTFESMSAGARWLNRDAAFVSVISHIRRSIQTGMRAYGYRWKEVV